MNKMKFLSVFGLNSMEKLRLAINEETLDGNVKNKFTELI